ncbi:MAG: hypothetical protein MK096_06380 [Oleiphilaceae bacterium]|nr:hypothetical protein [Oleiphilaceae bacterium]
MRLLSLLTILLLVGCASKQSYQTYKFDAPTKNFGLATLQVNKGLPVKYERCENGVCTQHQRSHISALWQTIQDSGYFSEVILNPLINKADTHIFVELNNTIEKGNEATQYSKIVVQALTLYLLPFKYNITHEAKFHVLVNDQLIKSYDYKIEGSYWYSLFTPGRKTSSEQAAKSFATRFLSDISKDQILDQKYTTASN